MEDINQDGNSEIAGNKAIIGSGISQIEATEKNKKKTKAKTNKQKSNLYCESYSEVLVLFVCK